MPAPFWLQDQGVWQVPGGQEWQRRLLLTEVTGDAVWRRTGDRPPGSIPEVPQGVGPGSQVKRLVMSKGPPPTTKLPLLGAGLEPVAKGCSESTTALQSCPFGDKVKAFEEAPETCGVVAEGDPTPHVWMQADVLGMVPAVIIQNNVNLIHCCLVQ